MKPKLLVIELWGVGDLAIASSFLTAAAERYEVTLLAKSYSFELQQRFWPNVKVIPFAAPWTAFEGKYKIWNWPWCTIFRIWRQLRGIKFDYAVSGRWDPRDHFLMWIFRATERLGFPRSGSQIFLTQRMKLPDRVAHRVEFWRQAATDLGLNLAHNPFARIGGNAEADILLHSGAAQPVRVWPLTRYKTLVRRLRENGYSVQVACDPDQRGWWLDSGETNVATPQTISELLQQIERAALFIGNDSGPGHLAAILGSPTFTLFGPQLPEWFVPLHPRAQFIEGKACPYKPCLDCCRFPAPHCLLNVSEEEVWERVQHFAKANQCVPLVREPK